MPTTLYEIPLSPEAQTFQVAIDGKTYTLTFRYIGIQGAWNLDIADGNGTLMLGGIPVVPGVDLLAQYRYLGFSSALVVANDPDDGLPPTFSGLGISGHVYSMVTT